MSLFLGDPTKRLRFSLGFHSKHEKGDALKQDGPYERVPLMFMIVIWRLVRKAPFKLTVEYWQFDRAS